MDELKGNEMKKLMLMLAGAVSLSAFGGLIDQPERVFVDYLR